MYWDVFFLCSAQSSVVDGSFTICKRFTCGLLQQAIAVVYSTNYSINFVNFNTMPFLYLVVKVIYPRDSFVPQTRMTVNTNPFYYLVVKYLSASV